MAAVKLSLPEGCRLVEEPSGTWTLESPQGPVPIAAHPEAVGRLIEGNASEEELVAESLARSGYEGIGQIYALLFDLHERGLLRREVRSGGVPLLRSVALTAACPFSREGFEEDGRYVLSRFALLHRTGEDLVLESPRGLTRVSLHGEPAAALLMELTRPRRAREVGVAGLDSETVELAFDLLWQGELLSAVDAEGEAEEDRHPALRQWELHDLFFHARSRVGRHSGGYGATYRWRGKAEPLPAMKAGSAGALEDLERPDLEELLQSDVPFTRVVEERRSLREQGSPPIDRRQLGELLYRAARVTEEMEAPEGEVTRRPYPGGGAAYELEIYVAVGDCKGLLPGLYRYRPDTHQLERVRDDTPEVQRLRESAQHTGRAPRPVQVLLLLAARFRRLSWKYESMVYATVLKDVGVLMQTIYLVATAMGLAVCAVGGGNSDLFAEATGLDYYEESTVGELILGSRSDSA